MVFLIGIVVGMIAYHALYTKVSSFKAFADEITVKITSLFK